ncbi:DUF1194 domain-containing protein [Primorskyibacter aestuariivivens]|uniref:DUF1194 domain-containing protein n=1 Tax=Primorskyibacter aestuariivivens TaxID=1888912 RepID=UPI0023019EE1|nr:DUF1194 domain-containing protein [Primorskyibacter aestuariivivens]MDA7427387.1 DUF1194 domain-containing protein [Primorskyibacter aestuariivivens]
MRWLAACCLLVWTTVQATGAQASCRLALVLAVDVSSSVDAQEHALQRRGLAAALTDAGVAAAMLDGTGEVALAIFEWSGRRQQKIIQDWVRITSLADLENVATRVLRAERSYTEFPTAMGYALGYAAGMLRDAPTCDRSVVDVSGDGVTNDGFRPQLAYKHFPFAGVTVNGLVVTGDDPRVVPYYRQEVLHGPRAFLERADGYQGFQEAMTRKLYRETRELVLGRR